MSVFSEQLKKARLSSGYSVKEAVELFHRNSITISEKTLYGWERGIRTPDADVFLTICKIYHVDSISDFLGQESDVSPQYLNEMNAKYLSLDEHGRKVVDMLLEEEFKRAHPIVPLHTVFTGPEEEIQYVDFLVSDQPAAAGYGAYLGEDSFTVRSVPETLIKSGASFGVPVSGNSMEPNYYDGDILLINKAQIPSVGEIGLFLLDGKVFVKQRGRKELISLNSQYDPIPMNDETRCFGKVIGVIRREELDKLQ